MAQKEYPLRFQATPFEFERCNEDAPKEGCKAISQASLPKQPDYFWVYISLRARTGRTLGLRLQLAGKL
jgi:hypothetical protein